MAKEIASEPPSGKSSLGLLERAKRGDGEAPSLLYERYLPPLQRWAKGRLPRWARSLAGTDDLVQEVLLGSLRVVEAFDPRHSGAFQAYLRQASPTVCAPRSGGRSGALGQRRSWMTRRLTPEQMRDVVAYFASLASGRE